MGMCRHVEVRQQCMGISSLLPCESPGSNLVVRFNSKHLNPLIHLANLWKSFYQVHGLGLCFSLPLAWPTGAGFCFPFCQQLFAQKPIVSLLCLPLGVGARKET